MSPALGFCRLRIAVVLRDERNRGKPLDVTFQGALHPGQSIAAADLLAHDIGVLSATTAFGKTVVAAAVIRAAVARGQRVLFADHRREITRQTSNKLHDAGLDFGIIQAGFPSRPGEPVQIAQSKHCTLGRFEAALSSYRLPA